MACTCNTVCTAQCTPVCNTVGSVPNAYGVPDVPSGAKATPSVFAKIANAINAFRVVFGRAIASMSVSAAADILASDWNSKIRANITEITWASNVAPYTQDQSIIPSAATPDSTKITNSGFTPNEIIALLNTKYCTLVCLADCKLIQSVCTDDCGCDGYCGDCGCDGYCACDGQCTCEGIDLCGFDFCTVEMA